MAKRKAVLLCPLSEERRKRPFLKELWRGQKSFHRGQCGASRSPQHTAQNMEQSSWETPEHGMGPWCPHIALTESLLGASRNGAGLGAGQSTLKTGLLREGLGAPYHVNTQEPRRCSEQGGEGTGTFFCSKICLFSVLGSLDHICADSVTPLACLACSH